MSETTHQRVDLAREQLDVALQLFLESRSMVSALTLAGAAEEILGKALKHSNRTTSLQSTHEDIADVVSLLHRERYTFGKFCAEWNMARNAAKHMDTSSEAAVVADLELEAARMIVRACENFDRLGLERTQRIADFDEWFWKNVVGTEDDV